jgi:hypothetical protein
MKRPVSARVDKIDLGMNIGVSATFALARTVLACVLTAVTRLSCATMFKACSRLYTS